MSFKFSVTTVMLPEHDLHEAAALLSKLGFQGVEWRTRRIPPEHAGKPFSFWGNHKNDLTPERFKKEAKEIRKLCDDHGLRIVGLAPQAAVTQLDDVALLADGAAEAGAGNSRGESYPVAVRLLAPRWYDGTIPYPTLFLEAVEAFGKALEITRARKVKVLVEIHNNTIVVSASLTHRLLVHFSPDDIGAIYDINNMTRDGYETPRIALELLGPYLAHVHLGATKPVAGAKDAAGTVQWKWEGCPLGEGLLHLPGIFSELSHAHYTGFVSLEDFRVAPAEGKLMESLAYLKAIGVAG